MISENANANMTTYEAIMVRTNKTSEWIDKLTLERWRKLINRERESTNMYVDLRAREKEMKNVLTN